MIDLKRRHFLFGAAAATTTLIVPSSRTFYIMPSWDRPTLIPNQPFDIAAALRAARRGDTVEVPSGIYDLAEKLIVKPEVKLLMRNCVLNVTRDLDCVIQFERDSLSEVHCVQFNRMPREDDPKRKTSWTRIIFMAALPSELMLQMSLS